MFRKCTNNLQLLLIEPTHPLGETTQLKLADVAAAAGADVAVIVGAGVGLT